MYIPNSLVPDQGLRRTRRTGKKLIDWLLRAETEAHAREGPRRPRSRCAPASPVPDHVRRPDQIGKDDAALTGTANRQGVRQVGRTTSGPS